MNRQALEKMWVKSRAGVPHADRACLDRLAAASRALERPGPGFWGLVDGLHRADGLSVLHCFNFGNITVKFPWAAEAVNRGVRVPLVIRGSGNVRLRRTFRTMLHQMETPFLVFVLEEPTLAAERVENGFLLTQPATATMVREREIALLPGNAPPAGGVFFYYLMKRLAFCGEPLEPVPCPAGGPAPWPRFRMTLQEPYVLEPGWIVHLLEKDRYLWGVVLR